MNTSGTFLEGVGQAWRDYYAELMAAVKVLVVDDEPLVYEVVEAILEDAGWQVEVAESAEEAWESIQGGGFGLLVTDKNLPGMTGVELIEKIRDASIDLPSLVITGYASVESIANALAAGASDYVTKPFDDVEHVRKRATSIIERSLLTRLYNRIVEDLTSLVSECGSEQERVRRIGRELFAFKKDLNSRPELMLIAADAGEGAELVESLEKAGHSVRVEHTKDAAVSALSEPGAPLASVVSLQLRFPVALVADLLHWDPLLKVIVTSSSPRLDDALAAVEAGANDFFIHSVERIEALEVRARRAVENSHRDRLYLHLIAILHREAAEQGHQLANTILDLLPEDHREYLQRMTGSADEELPEIDIELSDLFDDAMEPLSEERRSHRRISASDVEVWYRIKGSGSTFSRGWLRDVSLGGFFLRTEPALMRGLDLEVHLLVRGDPPDSAIGLEGRVVRVEVHDPDPEDLSGSGILASEDAHEALEALVARLTNDCA